MQPTLKSTVKCTDREVGEITRIIVDPLSLEVSHIVVGDGTGGQERQVPMSEVQQVVSHAVQLRIPSSEMGRFPVLNRDEYVTIHEVEIAHLEERLHVEPGEVLVPVPDLERNIKRRTFFTNLTHAIGILLGLPLIYPVMKYLMQPMYLPYDNRWIKVGNVNRIKVEDTGVQFKFRKKVKEAFMPEVEILKNVWLLKATPEVLDEVYKGEDMQFRDSQGSLIWTNKRAFPYVAYSGKCPHLGCGYKWRKVRKLPREIFLCPCHISIYDVSGKVLDGPAPRPLDPVPIRVSDNGDVEIIDVEFKAGVRDRIRIL
ncbi:ubiquinol-cytochrome c reductase iron-sulfur subunit [Nitrospiraceae bacterium AH_259_D15_M11_P09]|nr:ubiquinol-cytochrome c reductase iron-sulfur subunit [Nitrospiraceae bacterium AH_259_D15_M11_P09]